MLRLARPFTAALLWLAIALLPLRGWAAAAMPVVQGSAKSTMAAMALVDAHAELAPPCHAAHDEAADGDRMDSEHTCSQCDLCHATAAPAPVVGLPLSPWPAGLPRSEPTPPIEPAVADGPERPPRHPLA